MKTIGKVSEIKSKELKSGVAYNFNGYIIGYDCIDGNYYLADLSSAMEYVTYSTIQEIKDYIR